MNLYCKYCDKSFDSRNGLLCCPTGKDNFHVLVPRIPINKLRFPKGGDFHRDSNPFLFFGNFISSYHLLGQKGYKELADEVNDRLKRLGEPGFHISPVINLSLVEKKLKLSKQTIFIKDETENVTGSHKARHAMGNLLYLEAQRRLAKERKKKDLAIYSCGNAALGASAVACALGYKLYAFVPEEVDRKIVERLVKYKTKVVKVKRDSLGSGDPCYLRFKESVEKLSLVPCSCSGPDNWPNIEGGATLFYEMTLQMRHQYDTDLDTVIVQVGGGALASSVVYAISILRNVGFLKKIPRIICVQTESCYPLSLALKKVIKYKKENPRLTISNLFRDIGNKGNKFMSAWTRNVPESLAEGILDDTTYDWLNVIEGILQTNGDVVVVSEEEVRNAYELIKSIGLNVSATGTTGLAGLLQLLKGGQIDAGEKVGLLFTGIEDRKNIMVDPDNIANNTCTLSKKDPIGKITG